MSKDDQFTALGPTEIGFQTDGANIRIGAQIAGREAGVRGHCDTAVGIEGTGGAGGVHGSSQAGDGVAGVSDAVGKSGVFGSHSGRFGPAFGVSGTTGSPDGAAINGFTDAGVGVRGGSQTNDGVAGASNTAGKSGVFGSNSHTSGPAFGVSGTTSSPDGAAINGFSDQGYGATLKGGRAPLHLEPGTLTGPPTSGNHQRGEVFVDGAGDLFFCREQGTPGSWFRVQLIAV